VSQRRFDSHWYPLTAPIMAPIYPAPNSQCAQK